MCPLYLEDETIFQKSLGCNYTAILNITLLADFWLRIRTSKQTKKNPPGMCCHIGRCRYIICIGSCRTNWLYIPGSIQTGDFQMPITLSKIYSFCYVFWSPWSDASFALLNFQDLLKNIFSLWKKLDPYSTHVCTHHDASIRSSKSTPICTGTSLCMRKHINKKHWTDDKV